MALCMRIVASNSMLLLRSAGVHVPTWAPAHGAIHRRRIVSASSRSTRQPESLARVKAVRIIIGVTGRRLGSLHTHAFTHSRIHAFTHPHTTGRDCSVRSRRCRPRRAQRRVRLSERVHCRHHQSRLSARVGIPRDVRTDQCVEALCVLHLDRSLDAVLTLTRRSFDDARQSPTWPTRRRSGSACTCLDSPSRGSWITRILCRCWRIWGSP